MSRFLNKLEVMSLNAILTTELKRNFVIGKLLEKGITKSQDGTNIYDLDYDALKYELVLAAFREIDINADSNKWF